MGRSANQTSEVASYRPATDYAICLGLLVLVVIVYGQVYRFDYVAYDDNQYVYENKHTLKGLTGENLAWALTTGDVCNWQPLTWYSYLLDIQLFGKNPGAQHVVNILFHAANTLLLFLLLRRMTSEAASYRPAADSATWPSAFVAALFAVHPLHVESVAWIAERKDVLSTFFWLLTIAGYLVYVKRPGVARYPLFALPYILGLMAKPMVVTAPATLLLLDYWPLGRFRFSAQVEAPKKAKAERAKGEKGKRGKGERERRRDGETGRRNVRFEISDLRSKTQNLESGIQNPKPETRNPKPETRNPKPETRNPKPETRNPKPETRNPSWAGGRSLSRNCRCCYLRRFLRW
jgi:hypothetical protein